MLVKTIKQFFPNSIVVDAALKFPITEYGWDVECPQQECRFGEPDFWLILNLQDMLTTTDDGSCIELERIHATYKNWAPLDRIIVIAWPQGLAEEWNERKSFKVIEFSTHQYETWEAYKRNEDTLREAFKDKDLQDNFLCMNRIDKPHRRAVYNAVKDFPGNSSFQQDHIELKYPGFTYTEYDSHYDNLMNLLTLKKNFNTSLFSIITESQYYERYGIVTEKVFNAIVAGHPFIVIGHRGILEHIKNLGFKTYDSVFNEEYDDAHNEIRLSDALYDNLMYLSSKMKQEQLYDLMYYCEHTIDYNRDYFFNEFGLFLKNSLEQQLLQLWS